MSPLLRTALCAALALAAAPREGSSWAFETPGTYCAPGAVHWARPADGQVRYVDLWDRCVTWPTMGLAMFPTVRTMTTSEWFAAGAWAHWMYYREARTSVALRWQSTQYCLSNPPPGSAWVTSGPGNQYGLDHISSCLNSSALGCAWASSSCYLTGTQQTIDWANVAMAVNQNWQKEQINTLADCLNVGNYGETTWSHEAGHMYGFVHNDGWMTAMNSVSTGHHLCNVGAGFHTQPYADESQGMITMYPRWSAGSQRNVSGTPFFWQTYGTTVSISQGAFAACSNVTFPVRFTWMNHYEAIPSPGIGMRLAAVPLNVTQPTAAQATWTGSYVVIPTSHTFPGATYEQQFNVTVNPLYVAPSGTAVRIWVHMDPYNLIAETDEGDNFVPTGVILMRGASCP